MRSEVYNTDSIEFLKNYNIEEGKIDLVITDPPYELPSWSGGGFMNEEKRDWINEMNVDNLSRSYNIEKYAEMLYNVQGGKINAYFFCNKLQIPEYFRVYIGKYKCKFDILTWHKDNAMPTFKGKYLTDTEYILYFRNKGGCAPKCYEDAKTWWVKSINIKDKEKYGHPTIKPLDIVRTLIRNSSKEGDLVFDGFLGSGTTRIGCYLEKRNFIGCEIDEKFYHIQEERFLEDIMGEKKIYDNNRLVKQLNLFQM